MNRRKFKRKFGDDKKFVRSMYPNAVHESHYSIRGEVYHYIFDGPPPLDLNDRTVLPPVLGRSPINKGMAWRDARANVLLKMQEMFEL